MRDITSLDVKRADFKLDMLAPHLFMNFRVVDEHGRHLGSGRNLAALKVQWGAQERGAFQALAGLKTRDRRSPNVPLATLTTLGVGGPAARLVVRCEEPAPDAGHRAAGGAGGLRPRRAAGARTGDRADGARDRTVQRDHVGPGHRGGSHLAGDGPGLHARIHHHRAVAAQFQEQTVAGQEPLAIPGVPELGVVYASAQEQTLYQTSITAIASELKLQTVAYTPKSTLAQLGQQLTPRTPAMLLFVGGTPELAQFTQGLEKQDRQRYVVGLADINLQTLKQLGTSRSTPVIATQVVPMPLYSCSSAAFSKMRRPARRTA